MFGLLSVFPGLAAVISLYGLFATPTDVIRHMSAFSGTLPPGVWDLFNTELHSVAGPGARTLTVTAAIGLLVALWSARSAISALMTATNIADNEQRKRGLLSQALLSLALTSGAIVGFLAMLILGVAIPVMLDLLGTSLPVRIAVTVIRWGLLWTFAALSLAFVYRYAPTQEHARRRWVTWGSTIAATFWLATTLLFAYYARTFATYGKTYGTLGGVIVLLIWFYLSSLVVVLGAEINAELERPRV